MESVIAPKSAKRAWNFTARRLRTAYLAPSLSLVGWLALACSGTEKGDDPAASGGSGGMPMATGGTRPASGGTPSTGGTTAGPPTGGTVGSSGAPAGGSSGAAANGGAALGGSAGNAVSGGTGGGGAGGAGTGGGTSQGGTAGQAGGPSVPTAKFSFFVTSVGAMRELSGSQDGFGGDLRFGEPTGLEGADKICRTIAEQAMPGAGQKVWRAFLSTVAGGPNGGPSHAIDRIGEGPWFDRLGRVVAQTKADLMFDRPRGADPAIIDDLPNEDGVPNHIDGAPDCTGNECPDNHDVLTGTNPKGQLYSTTLGSTCKDWTTKENVDPATFGSGSGGGAGTGGGTSTGGGFGKGGFGRANGPWCGHSWPRVGSGVNWMSALAEGGCAAGINLAEMGGPQAGVWTVGTGGGYGAIYCFALTP